MKPGALVFISIFTLFWSAIVLGFDYFAGREIAGEWRSRTFTEAKGRVRSSKLTPHYGRGTSYSADIVYDYTVDGKAYAGSKLSYGVLFSSSYAQAQNAVVAHPAGAATAVFFDPANPADAVLEVGLSGPSLFITVFLAPFNVIMLGFWMAAIQMLRNAGTQPIAGGVRLLESDLRTRVRMPRFTALGAAMLTLAGASFAAVFTVGLSTRMNPSINTVIATWSSILAVSALVFLRRWLKIQSGAEDLVLDDGMRQLTLPRTFGRKETITVSYGDVKALVLDEVQNRSQRGGTTTTFAPTLQFKNDRKDEKLAVWGNREKAESFAAWLRQKIGLPVPS